MKESIETQLLNEYWGARNGPMPADLRAGDIRYEPLNEALKLITFTVDKYQKMDAILTKTGKVKKGSVRQRRY